VLVVLIVIAIVLMAAVWMLTQPFVIAIASRPPPVDPAALEAHVRMLSRAFYPRSFDQPDRLEAAASYVHAQLSSAGARVEDQLFTVEESRYRNIVGRYGPCDGETIVIGAHYDSYGDASEGAKFPQGYALSTHTPGADDNASGVAALIELGRLFAQSPPRICVELVAYALEEPPHFATGAMGSVTHARSVRRTERRVALMLSLEMIGCFSAQPASQTYPLPGMQVLYPTRGDFIAVVGRFADWQATRRVKAAMLGATDLPVRSINATALIPGVDFSDHRSYWDEDITALMITDTAFYRYPHYHGAGDTAERLDYRRMAKVVQDIFAIVQHYRD
jgi:Zn-dependent M28 family amino/carboxypeptidase